MNHDNERKSFLYELNGHGYHFKNTDWHEDWERFEDEQLNMVWEMWLASANREGYKLVPVEPTDIEIESIKEKHWGMRGCQLCKSDYIDLYKAMIGACDDH